MSRPVYCADDLDPEKDCPLCGEPPEGVCKAQKPWPKARDLIKIEVKPRTPPTASNPR